MDSYSIKTVNTRFSGIFEEFEIVRDPSAPFVSSFEEHFIDSSKIANDTIRADLITLRGIVFNEVITVKFNTSLNEGDKEVGNG